MNDIFLSYDSTDRAIAKKFADALESLGWSVWWDREIPLGKVFDQVIEQELSSARCVIVLWSKESGRSRWVKTEASAAVDRECLIPVLVEATEIPLEFKRIQTAMLLSWQGDAADPAFEPVIQAVRQLLGEKSATPVVSTENKVKRKPLQSQPSRSGIWIAIAAMLLLGVGIFAVMNFAPDVALPPGSNDAAINLSVTAQPQDPPATTPTSTDTAKSISPEDVAENRTASGQPQDSPSTPALSTNTKKLIAPKGAFSIKIGDKIDDGIPGNGAGSIEVPYSHDIYMFSATPRQHVYFHMLQHSTGMGGISWKLVDENGMKVFDTCLGCSEPGEQTLTKGGLYTLMVGADNNPATGDYTLEISSR